MQTEEIMNKWTSIRENGFNYGNGYCEPSALKRWSRYKKYSAASFFDTLFGSKTSNQNCTIRNDIEEDWAYGANIFFLLNFLLYKRQTISYEELKISIRIHIAREQYHSWENSRNLFHFRLGCNMWTMCVVVNCDRRVGYCIFVTMTVPHFKPQYLHQPSNFRIVCPIQWNSCFFGSVLIACSTCNVLSFIQQQTMNAKNKQQQH